MKKEFLWSIIFCCMTLIISLQAESTEPIKIAAIFAQTGEAAKSNASSLQGLHIAIKEINEQGGILGKKLELLIFDNQSTPLGSKVAAQNARKAGITAIIGAQWSSHSLVIAKLAQEHGIPMITNYSTNPQVTKTGSYIFRVCFTDPFQGRSLAQFVRHDLNAKTAVILKNVSSDYSMGLAQEFYKNFEAMQGKVLLELSYIQKERDFRQILHQSKQASPDVLFIPGHDESGLIAKQAQDLGIHAAFVGGDGWGLQSFYQRGGQDIRKGYYSTHWSEQIERKTTLNFLQNYRKHIHIETGTALAYDAVLLLADAIRRANTFDREKIRDALAQTKNFQGVTGDISLNENGDPIKDVVIMEIINGKAHYLKTISP